MELTIRKEEKAVIVSVTGRMDALAAPQFDKELETLLEGGETRIIIDFKDLEYISSAGLQIILAAAKKMEEVKGEIILLHLKDAVKEVFEISGFDTLFRIFEDQDAALA
ncbi:MAG: putative anti-sigma factor antagonist BtrV [Syntrophus sp. SKADARSKE-3]|nr:putative anti-sigma factor antagonist BtrV [Syntrophus sp. SKADARSKE-3]